MGKVLDNKNEYFWVEREEDYVFLRINFSYKLPRDKEIELSFSKNIIAY